ncbi:GCN5 family acetyltransferase [Pandoraea captiosa]|jgi:RimJ/RimL family protein N-acetyltransferase|uniref:GCN5 family acetyltransferase n=1 Tax=Pandoraea captiosa TaxID=2508302 RepID=A0A5E5ACZ8_9BURK|nr:GNAT family N-acetyltransferase [Pandoraea captiosa]VVE70996.1 GCN5 family acetyltransferase [Pandoraea captiosa]
MTSPNHTPDVARATVAANERSSVLIRELTSGDIHRLQRHFLALGEEDRLLRFGQAVSDDVITRYVASIDFSRDSVFGVYDDNLALVAVAHVAQLPEGKNGRVAEFGVSVLESARGRGIGSRLFERAAIHCRNKRVDTLYMHCLSRNARMMRIAKKAGMQINFAYGEADGYLSLPPADTHSMLSEMMQEQIAAFDYALKRQLRNARRLVGALLPNQRAA